MTYCVNLSKNLGYSLLYTALSKVAGAHPLGFTSDQQVILKVNVFIHFLESIVISYKPANQICSVFLVASLADDCLAQGAHCQVDSVAPVLP